MVLDLRIITNRKLHHECTIGTPRDARGNLRGKTDGIGGNSGFKAGAGFLEDVFTKEYQGKNHRKTNFALSTARRVT